MQRLIQSVDILSFDESVIWETIKLRQEQKVKKLPDAIIAATAVAHNLLLITRNTSDFKNVTGLVTLNPHKEEELMILDLLDQS